MDLELEFMHAVTRYDRGQEKRKGYNPYALASIWNAQRNAFDQSKQASLQPKQLQKILTIGFAIICSNGSKNDPSKRGSTGPRHEAPMHFLKEASMFTVYWTDPEGDSYLERANLNVRAATSLAFSLTQRPAAKLGLIKKVIISDQDDCCVFLWRYGEGVVFPDRTLT